MRLAGATHPHIGHFHLEGSPAGAEATVVHSSSCSLCFTARVGCNSSFPGQANCGTASPGSQGARRPCRACRTGFPCARRLASCSHRMPRSICQTSCSSCSRPRGACTHPVLPIQKSTEVLRGVAVVVLACRFGHMLCTSFVSLGECSSERAAAHCTCGFQFSPDSAAARRETVSVRQ